MELEELLNKLKSDLPAKEYIALMHGLTSFPGEKAAKALGAFLEHPDYLVRSKAFAVLSLIPHRALLPKLLAILKEEKDEEFRLRTLEAVQKVGDSAAIPDLIPFLHDRDPFIVRGLVAAMGGIGGEEAARAILEFAASPQGRIVRRELVQEALAYALQKVDRPEEFLAKIKEENKGVKRYLQGLSMETPPIPHFTVYPSADYFSLQAKARDIDYRTYKRLIG